MFRESRIFLKVVERRRGVEYVGQQGRAEVEGEGVDFGGGGPFEQLHNPINELVSQQDFDKVFLYAHLL